MSDIDVLECAAYVVATFLVIVGVGTVINYVHWRCTGGKENY